MAAKASRTKKLRRGGEGVIRTPRCGVSDSTPSATRLPRPFASSPPPPPPPPTRLLRGGLQAAPVGRPPGRPDRRCPRAVTHGGTGPAAEFENPPGKDEELGGGGAESPNLAPSPVLAACWGPSPPRRVLLLDAARLASLPAPFPALLPRSRPLPLPARLAGSWCPLAAAGPAGSGSSAQECRDRSHVPASSPPPVLPGGRRLRTRRQALPRIRGASGARECRGRAG
ncbi:wiskott-Aldrich syndrome protein homolog 1-like [Chiroxiphia lanceolata]|uniref:wiskott-Aldrich syndrome protein homolog 1-like n=1 Tax=Chiroxiphia lanceolata TaxID=296741 RepID=UPI0013CE8083|nr:wiskott-Aldrich syndrome protein homolog 1-like [Chiroxiphia lanceolata]